MTRRLPNIVVICSDQHNPNITGAYGDRYVDTPNLDRLAERSTVFDSMYSNCPLCCPSRMSFMTGRYPHSTGVFTNDSMLDSRIPSVAHLLHQAGYQTILAGRSEFLGPDHLHGFDQRLVGDLRPGPGRFAPLEGDLGNGFTESPLLTVGGGNTCFIDYDSEVTRSVAHWLKENYETPESQPFFLFVGYILPHCPYIAPTELYSKYANLLPTHRVSANELNRQHQFHQDFRVSIGLEGVPDANQTAAKAAYYGLVETLDRNVGHILSALKHTGADQDCVVVYMSDHGEMLGSHGRWHKMCFYEESVRVPFSISLPQSTSQTASRVTDIVELVDLFPTLCDLAHIKLPYPINGESLLPLINGTPASRKKQHARSEYYGARSNRMIRTGQWKLNLYEGYEAPELFKLNEDPQELHDLAKDASYTSLLRELEDLLFEDGWSHALFPAWRERVRHTGSTRFLEAYPDAALRTSVEPFPNSYWDEMKHSSNYLEQGPSE